MPAEFGRNVNLVKASVGPRFDQHFHQRCMRVGENRFCHFAPPLRGGIELHAETAYAVFGYPVIAYLGVLAMRDWRRIEDEEWMRARTRERYAEHQERKREEEAEKQQNLQRYVELHGRDGAFRKIAKKWAVGAGLVSALGFFGEVGDDGFVTALGQSASFFFLVAGFGVVRAYHIANSAR